MDNYDVEYAKSLSASQKYEQLFAYCMEHETVSEAMADLSVCFFSVMERSKTMSSVSSMTIKRQSWVVQREKLVLPMIIYMA